MRQSSIKACRIFPFTYWYIHAAMLGLSPRPFLVSGVWMYMLGIQSNSSQRLNKSGKWRGLSSISNHGWHNADFSPTRRKQWATQLIWKLLAINLLPRQYLSPLLEKWTYFFGFASWHFLTRTREELSIPLGSTYLDTILPVTVSECRWMDHAS